MLKWALRTTITPQKLSGTTKRKNRIISIEQMLWEDTEDGGLGGTVNRSIHQNNYWVANYFKALKSTWALEAPRGMLNNERGRKMLVNFSPWNLRSPQIRTRVLVSDSLRKRSQVSVCPCRMSKGTHLGVNCNSTTHRKKELILHGGHVDS